MAAITFSSIVFVHGLSGNPESTWKNSITGFLWPKELEAHVPNARILLYGYDVHVHAALLRGRDHIRIKGLTERFLSELVNERVEKDV